MEKIIGTKPLLALVSVFFVILSALFFTCSKSSLENVIENSNDKFIGLCYGPHRDNEDPDFGVQPTISELKEDLALIKNLTFKIRTYGTTDNLEQIPVLCEPYKIKCYPGAWISRFECENKRQINNLINIANQNLSCVKGLIVGNEVLLREDIAEQQLLDFISEVKSAANLPVATAEIFQDWLDHPELAQAVDILLVHIYPYWDGIAVEDGANYVLEKWNQLRAIYPNKTMAIGETGWPSQGEVRGNAIPSEENQKTYLSDFIHMAKTNKIDYFYFEIFDEKWKRKLEGEAGSHWGLYFSDGTPKPYLIDFMPESAQNGINRPPRVVNPTEMTLPLYVYKDGCDPGNSFFSSGWMGELVNLMGNDTILNSADIIDELSTDNPYSGETCIRISYSPSVGQWGGIYWQFPVNNWGNYPGYDLSNSLAGYDSVKVIFWARGIEGEEKAEFKTGGINDFTLNHSDSYGPISTGVITLTNEWKEYSLVLTGEDLSMVIGGFSWVTNYNQNPNGSTIYLDEIVFEGYTSGISNRSGLTSF
jgi:exo-beta-1,3-glucanase (GH17 family)